MKVHSGDTVCMTQLNGRGETRLDIPELRGPVPRCGHEPMVVRCEICRAHQSAMTQRLTKQLSCSPIPDARGKIRGSRCDQLPIRTEAAKHHAAFVFERLADGKSIRRAPAPCRGVFGSRQHELIVAAEHDMPKR